MRKLIWEDQEVFWEVGHPYVNIRMPSRDIKLQVRREEVNTLVPGRGDYDWDEWAEWYVLTPGQIAAYLDKVMPGK